MRLRWPFIYFQISYFIMYNTTPFLLLNNPNTIQTCWIPCVTQHTCCHDIENILLKWSNNPMYTTMNSTYSDLLFFHGLIVPSHSILKVITELPTCHWRSLAVHISYTANLLQSDNIPEFFPYAAADIFNIFYICKLILKHALKLSVVET